MGLRDIESTLPPGFRFHPSDEELVCHYLYKKVTNKGLSEGTMVEVDLHTREPWELPDEAKLSANEWYFFSFRDRKYATGSRTNRATKSGYWKATGKDRTVYYPKTHAVVGMRKTLVFYRGRAPNGIKSGWVMHEFRMENPHTPPKEDWVLCRVFHKRKVNTENNSSAMEKEHENTVECSSSPLQMESSPPPLVDDITLEGCLDLVSSSFAGLEHQDDMISSNPFLNLALVHYNLVDFGNPQDVDGSQMMMMGSSSGDGCGFLFDDDDEDAGAEQDDDNRGSTSGRDKLFF